MDGPLLHLKNTTIYVLALSVIALMTGCQQEISAIPTVESDGTRLGDSAPLAPIPAPTLTAGPAKTLAPVPTAVPTLTASPARTPVSTPAPTPTASPARTPAPNPTPIPELTLIETTVIDGVIFTCGPFFRGEDPDHHFIDWSSDGARLIFDYEDSVWAVDVVGTLLQRVVDANPRRRRSGTAMASCTAFMPIFPRAAPASPILPASTLCPTRLSGCPNRTTGLSSGMRSAPLASMAKGNAV